MTLSITTLCHYAECHSAEFRVLFIVMLNVIMQNVVMMSVVMLSVVVLSVVVLSVVVLSVIVLSAVAPFILKLNFYYAHSYFQTGPNLTIVSNKLERLSLGCFSSLVKCLWPGQSWCLQLFVISWSVCPFWNAFQV